VTHLSPVALGPSDEHTKKQTARSKGDSAPHSKDSIMSNKNTTSEMKTITISSEEEFQQIGQRKEDGRLKKLAKMKKPLVDKNPNELFQMYDSDSSYQMIENKFSSLKKLGKRKSKKYDEMENVVPS